MKFGISLLQSGQDLAEFRDLSVQAEQTGFERVGVPDSHSILRDCYVAMAVCAAATSRIGIGPMVTNPLTRHPSVTASGMLSIHELSGGRAFLGIASGNSAIYNLGLKPPSTVGLESAVSYIRSALSGELAGDGSLRAELAWGSAPELPILVAASGPKALAVAGRVGDGVVIDLGADPAIVGKAARVAREAHAQSPRADQPFEVWVLGKCYVSEDLYDARNAVATIMAASANDAFRQQLEWKEVPEDLRPALVQFHHEYSFVKHASTVSTSTSNVDLLDRLGLTEFIYDRFAMIGTGADVAERIRALAGVGVDGVSFTGAIRDKATFMDKFASDVRPLLSGSAA